MREPSPRAPFDQGLFLTHFNKGKAFYEERRFEDAEQWVAKASSRAALDDLSVQPLWRGVKAKLLARRRAFAD